MRVIVLGSSAIFPLPRTKSNRFEDYLDIAAYQKKFPLHNDLLCNSARKGGKDRRTRSSIAVLTRQGAVLFDAGPDIRYQLKRHHLQPAAVFISHAHPDASYGLKYLDKSKVKIFRGLKKPVNIFGVKVEPFKVRHSRRAPYTGHLIEGKVAYMTDVADLRGVKPYLINCSVLFADGSNLKRDWGGHLSIISQLKVYKKWELKKVVFTHIGHQTLPHYQLRRYLQRLYKNTDVAYDGMRLTA